ncbi:MAG: hypothetical protein K6T65_14310 [Peptococcaceae bacterium]|nr:hypothetical protein [Peptococcaceae bacterium]
MPTIPIADKATLDAVLAYVDELESRLTAVRAGYLDFLNDLNTRLTDARAAYLDAAISGRASSAQATQIIGYVDELESRLTAARAGYMDKIPNIDYRLSPVFNYQKFTLDDSWPSSYTTAINISGYRGILALLTFNWMVQATTAATAHVDIRMTLDGVERVITQSKSIGSSGSFGDTIDYFLTSPETTAREPVRFLNQLKVEYRCVIDSGSANFISQGTGMQIHYATQF